MTPAQVRDAIEAALAALPPDGAEAVVPVGPGRLVVTFADTRAVVTVSTYRRQP